MHSKKNQKKKKDVVMACHSYSQKEKGFSDNLSYTSQIENKLGR